MHWRKRFLCVALLFAGCTRGWAQEPASSSEASCFNSSVASLPSRPTVANATDTTECGVMELEYGLERQWPGSGANRDDLSGGLRLGLTHDLDFHWASSDFLHVKDSAGDRTGFGDTWLGLKYRFLPQTKRRPSMGVFYQAKLPSARTSMELGSGEVDHSISFLVSKDIGRIRCDFNVIELLANRPTSGLDHDTGLAASFSSQLKPRLNLIVEPYGYTSLNPSTPAFAAAMAGVLYRVQGRMYLDGGVDVGLNSAAPKARFFVGVTYAVGNLYSWMRPRQ